MTEIKNCLHKYCLNCISVSLESLLSDEERIQCFTANCETSIYKMSLEQFSMTPMVKQKEVRCQTCFELVQLQFVTAWLVWYDIFDGHIA